MPISFGLGIAPDYQLHHKHHEFSAVNFTAYQEPCRIIKAFYRHSQYASAPNDLSFSLYTILCRPIGSRYTQLEMAIPDFGYNVWPVIELLSYVMRKTKWRATSTNWPTWPKVVYPPSAFYDAY